MRRMPTSFPSPMRQIVDALRILAFRAPEMASLRFADCHRAVPTCLPMNKCTNCMSTDRRDRSARPTIPPVIYHLRMLQLAFPPPRRHRRLLCVLVAGQQVRDRGHPSERHQQRSVQIGRRSASFNGILRIRLPVAANSALSTAGAATAMVGSPIPPQNPPDGMMRTSTSGISASSIDL